MFHQWFSCVLLTLPLFARADPVPLRSSKGESLELVEHGIFQKFNDFLLTFGRHYENVEEFNKRYEIFKSNLKTIDRLNQEQRGSAIFCITKFADLTLDEFLRNFTGGRISQENLKWHAEAMEIDSEVDIEFMENDFKSGIKNDLAKGKTVGVNEDIRVVGGKVFLPKKFDYRKKGAVTPVKNQGFCGSCWAFSTMANIEGVYKKSKGKLYNLAEQELVDCDKVNNGCSGGWMHLAVNELVRFGGVAQTSDYPYEGFEGECRFNASTAVVKVAGTKAIPANEKQIAKALVKNGPLSVAVNAMEAFMFYKEGVFNPTPSQCSSRKEYVNHAVTLVAYGEELKSEKKDKTPYWVIKNSWDANWGEKGYMRIVRGKNACAIKTHVSTAFL